MLRHRLIWLARLLFQATFGGMLVAHAHLSELRARWGGELTDPSDVAPIAEWGHMHIEED
jgi:hypothetical protein